MQVRDADLRIERLIHHPAERSARCQTIRVPSAWLSSRITVDRGFQKRTIDPAQPELDADTSASADMSSWWFGIGSAREASEALPALRWPWTAGTAVASHV